MTGIDQQARNPQDKVKSRGSSQSGSVAISLTMTGSLRNAAVPHEHVFPSAPARTVENCPVA
jgi:hypothetical protein